MEFSILNSQLSILCLLCLLLATTLLGCAHRGRPPEPAAPAHPPKAGTLERGIASWYGHPYHGRRTASGEVYDMHQLTAAHRALAFGTVVRVVRRDTGASVEVRINDRGPFIEGRIIDLSYEAARRVGLDIDGVAPVTVEVLPARRVDAPPPGNRPGQPEPLPETRDRCFWVQVGAFGDVDNARRARAALERAGEKAVVLVGPRGLSRVRVGPFEERERAEAARGRILGDWPEAQVVACGG